MNDIMKRLEALEEKVARIKDWKQKYEDAKAEWEKERGRLLKSAGAVGRLKEVLSQFLELDSVSAPTNLAKGALLSLNHEELAVRLSHSIREVSMTTKTAAGRVLFCVLTELSKDGFGETEISEAMKEHGWNVGHSTLAPTLGGLVRDGLLVRLAGVKPTKYRLPQKVKINIKESE